MSHREINNIKWAITGINRNNYFIPSPDQMIKIAVQIHGNNLTLGWSGGRCSTVVLHKTLQIKPDLKVIYTNTGIEFPENVDYVRELAEKWKVNLFELHPDTTYWKIVEEHGMPKFRKFGDNKTVKKLQRYGVKVDRRPFCCYYLKEKPRFEFYKEHKITGDITGMRAAESRVRARTFNRRGLFYTIKRPHITSYHPIGLWTTTQVEAYLEENKIPHNPVYDTQDRNGCWACTAYKGWEKNIMKYDPKKYKFLQKKRGVMLMDDYIPNLVPCEAEDVSV